MLAGDRLRAAHVKRTTSTLLQVGNERPPVMKLGAGSRRGAPGTSLCIVFHEIILARAAASTLQVVWQPGRRKVEQGTADDVDDLVFVGGLGFPANSWSS